MVQNLLNKVFNWSGNKKPQGFTPLRISGLSMCSGCSACFNICPAGAISMEEDKEGFIYPVVESSLCTNCGLCERVCPYLYPVENKNMPGAECFAVMADDDIRMESSSSGGAFTILAEFVVNNGGYVCGAELTEDGAVEHVIVNTVDDIKRLRGAKYLQSNIASSYKEIKKLLMAGRQVLFVGTPCQTAGLKSYLGINYEKLITIDIICHGVPSPKVFQKYLADLIPQDEVFVSTKFLDKKCGWDTEHCKITTSSNNCDYSANLKDDTFLKAYYNNLSLRKSCGECCFQTIPRQGDLTIGDFRGIDEYDSELDDGKGISVLLVNNMKGKAFLDSINNGFKLLKNVPLKFAIEGNQNLVSASKIHYNRNLFFNYFETKGLQEALDLALTDKCDYLIVSYWWALDYGASISSWALQVLIEKFGFIPKFLNHKDLRDGLVYEGSFSEKFADEYLYTTREVKTFDDLKSLSTGVKGIIAGSDNVFNIECMCGNVSKYLLDWTCINNKKFAIAANFGLDKDYFAQDSFLSSDVFRYMKSALNTFDYISCREDSGVNICKDVFNISSDFLLDPVFLIDKEEYDDILVNSGIRTSGKVVSYIFEANDRELYTYIKGKYGFDVNIINGKNESVQNWLKAIRDCRFLITDSFYGVCFALIFNRPFVCIKKDSKDAVGLENLCSMFGLDEFFIDSISEFYNKDFLFGETPDWKIINSIIAGERKKGLKKLEKVLKDTKPGKGKEQYITHLLYNGFAGIFKQLHTELTFKTFVSKKDSRCAYFMRHNSEDLPDWLKQKNIYIPELIGELPDGDGVVKVYNEMISAALNTLDVVVTDDVKLASAALKLKKLVCLCANAENRESSIELQENENLLLRIEIPQVSEFETCKHRANLKFLKQTVNLEDYRSYFY